MWLLVSLALCWFTSQVAASVTQCAPVYSTAPGVPPSCLNCLVTYPTNLYKYNQALDTCEKIVNCPSGWLEPSELSDLRNTTFLQSHSHFRAYLRWQNITPSAEDLENSVNAAYAFFCTDETAGGNSNSQYLDMTNTLLLDRPSVGCLKLLPTTEFVMLNDATGNPVPSEEISEFVQNKLCVAAASKTTTGAVLALNCSAALDEYGISSLQRAAILDNAVNLLTEMSACELALILHSAPSFFVKQTLWNTTRFETHQTVCNFTQSWNIAASTQPRVDWWNLAAQNVSVRELITLEYEFEYACQGASALTTEIMCVWDWLAPDELYYDRPYSFETTISRRVDLELNVPAENPDLLWEVLENTETGALEARFVPENVRCAALFGNFSVSTVSEIAPNPEYPQCDVEKTTSVASLDGRPYSRYEFVGASAVVVELDLSWSIVPTDPNQQNDPSILKITDMISVQITRTTVENTTLEPVWLENHKTFFRALSPNVYFENPADKTTCYQEAVMVHQFDVVSACGARITNAQVEENDESRVSARPTSVPLFVRTRLPTELGNFENLQQVVQTVRDLVFDPRVVLAQFESRSGRLLNATITVNLTETFIPNIDLSFTNTKCLEDGFVNNATITLVATDECGQTNKFVWSPAIYRKLPDSAPIRHLVHTKPVNEPTIILCLTDLASKYQGLEYSPREFAVLAAALLRFPASTSVLTRYFDARWTPNLTEFVRVPPSRTLNGHIHEVVLTLPIPSVCDIELVNLTLAITRLSADHEPSPNSQNCRFAIAPNQFVVMPLLTDPMVGTRPSGAHLKIKPDFSFLERIWQTPRAGSTAKTKRSEDQANWDWEQIQLMLVS